MFLLIVLRCVKVLWCLCMCVCVCVGVGVGVVGGAEPQSVFLEKKKEECFFYELWFEGVIIYSELQQEVLHFFHYVYIYIEYFADPLIQLNLQPFIHTPTAESTTQGDSQLVRVRCLAQGHLRDRSGYQSNLSTP